MTTPEPAPSAETRAVDDRCSECHSAEPCAHLAIPFDARRAMQKAIWERVISPRTNEWTTWTDSIIVAEVAAAALWEAGYTAARNDGQAPSQPWDESQVEAHMENARIDGQADG